MWKKTKHESNVSPINISTILFFSHVLLLFRRERKMNKNIHLDDLLVRRSRFIEERIQWIRMKLNWIQNAHSSH